MFEVVLCQPQIPPNTGNIIRLCANVGCRLHLIAPLGFALDDRSLRRAGLDYQVMASVSVYPDFDSFIEQHPDERRFTYSSHHTRPYHQAEFQPGDALIFGSETKGLPTAVSKHTPSEHQLLLPMRAGSRSLNLSNAVAIAVYEAFRQRDFDSLGTRTLLESAHVL